MEKVLLLHTGGTLGMRGTPLEPGEYAANLLDAVPEIGQLAELDSEIVCNMDSSDMGPEQWRAVAMRIAEQREAYTGFVIVHGTDTMGYTAGALAFALEGLDKPVILTGAQRPLSALRSDARRNLADAVELATYDIPEVAICFDGLLLRGSRTRKYDNRHYRAFTSPGVEPLATMGVDVEIAPHVRLPERRFACVPVFDERVAVLHVHPGISPTLVGQIMCSDEVRGVVLCAFGLGTVPRRFLPIAPVVREAVDAGIEVVVITQSGGCVDLSRYQNSIPLLDAGAIAGGEMLVEAATTKLMHALARFESADRRRRYLMANQTGELR